MFVLGTEATTISPRIAQRRSVEENLRKNQQFIGYSKLSLNYKTVHLCVKIVSTSLNVDAHSVDADFLKQIKIISLAKISVTVSRGPYFGSLFK